MFVAIKSQYFFIVGCAAGLWQCADKSCIPETMRCDGRPQCEDSSDEINCREWNTYTIRNYSIFKYLFGQKLQSQSVKFHLLPVL